MTSVLQLSSLDISPVQKNQMEKHLNEIIDQMDFIDIYRTFLPNTAKYTFFSIAYGTFSEIDHILYDLPKLNQDEIIWMGLLQAMIFNSNFKNSNLKKPRTR